jgi:hypothetical protein
VKPADILEEIWVRDIVDLVWEAWRLRRLKAALMAANAHRGLSAALDPLVEWSERKALVADWVAREPEAIKQIDQILASAGLTIDSVMAQTLSIKLDDIERIDRMTALAEARRNAILREIDGHRKILSQNLRRAVQHVEDGQLSEEVEALAREIAGTDASHELQELARRIAEAQIDLRRVRSARHDLLSSAIDDPNYDASRAIRTKSKIAELLANA